MNNNNEIFNVSEEYNSDNIDDIIRERKNNQALREMFPYLFNGNMDNTIYHLIKYKDNGSFSKIRLNNDFFIIKINNTKTVEQTSLTIQESNVVIHYSIKQFQQL